MVPRSDPPPRTPAWIDCAVGFAFTEDMDDTHEVLQSSGRCHDWAVVAAYVLSIDKWLTAGVLLWARWLSWIAILIGTAMFVPGIIHPPISPVPNAMMECFMVLMALMDSLNLRTKQLKANKTCTPSIFCTKLPQSLMFFALLGVLCVLYLCFVPVWVHCFEFPACLLLSALACYGVHRLINSAAPHGKASTS